jgi:cell division protein FtsB
LPELLFNPIYHKMHSMSTPALAKYIIFTLLFTVAAVNFTRTTMDVLQSSQRLDNLKEEVISLEEKRSFLERTLDYKRTEEFIEESARNTLNMIKPGERVFVAPEVLAASTEGSDMLSKTRENKSNVQLWLELLF